MTITFLVYSTVSTMVFQVRKNDEKTEHFFTFHVLRFVFRPPSFLCFGINNFFLCMATHVGVFPPNGVVLRNVRPVVFQGLFRGFEFKAFLSFSPVYVSCHGSLFCFSRVGERVFWEYLVHERSNSTLAVSEQRASSLLLFPVLVLTLSCLSLIRLYRPVSAGRAASRPNLQFLFSCGGGEGGGKLCYVCSRLVRFCPSEDDPSFDIPNKHVGCSHC